MYNLIVKISLSNDNNVNTEIINIINILYKHIYFKI